jgi:sucrose phosphorylase
MLSLAGMPGIYIHSLFGSSNCQSCITETGQARSINREKFDVNILKGQLARSDSREARVLNGYLHLLNVRREQSAFHPLAPQEVILNDPGIFSILRRSLEVRQTILCLVNVTPQARQFCIDLRSGWLSSNSTWQDLIGGEKHSTTSSGLKIRLKPYQSCWLSAVDAGS